MPPVQLPRQLKTLDDLLAQAEHYANHSMRNIGRVPPTLFLIGADGPVLFIPENMADDSAKDDFATTARLMCIAHAASARDDAGSLGEVRQAGRNIRHDRTAVRGV